MDIYNDYVQYIRQYAVGVSNAQLLSELQPHLTTLKQKISNNEGLLEIYKGVSNSIGLEINKCASNKVGLSNLSSNLDYTTQNLERLSNGIDYLLEQPRLSSSLRNEVLSFQKECQEKLTFQDTQSALETLSNLKNKFLKEEEDRKAKQMALIIQILKWLGIVVGVLIVIGLILTYWKVIVTIIVIALIVAVVSLFSKK